MKVNARQMMADAKFYESYSRWIESEGRSESWEESVDRVMSMHKGFYQAKMTPELESLIDFAGRHYKEKNILGSQRALQFGGDQLLKHHARNYNCSVSYADRPSFFNEAMYMLMCGCGVGFSVQAKNVNKLPSIEKPNTEEVAIFKPEDSIEGWADCFAVILSSYFTKDQVFPEFAGKRVIFDLNSIRPKGDDIAGGFKAPGPEPLRKALDKVTNLLNIACEEGTRLRPIHVYDFVMHMSDAVLAGGVRRSATICTFDFDDIEMMEAKTGNWFETNPQRGRSNNSAIVLRDSITKDKFTELMKSVESFGEPGFIFTDNEDCLYNPCVEIGFLPRTEDGRSGFQVCNLTEISGAKCTSLDKFLDYCKASAIMGTLQAGYTDFKYLSKESKEITDREALLGCSITGWMNNPELLFDPETMRLGAETVKYWNKVVSDLIGIRQAARTTCVKPSGNASVMLGTASGIHGEHSPRYLRHVQMNTSTDIAKAIQAINPEMCEKSVWSANGTDIVVAFPIESPEGSIYKSDLYGVKQLEFVKKAQQVWVEMGTNEHLSVVPELRHNVSNTISVDNWAEVTEYVYENRKWFAGISFLGMSGDKDYAQAPFTEVLTAEQITELYGPASLFASGLLVQGVDAFGDLWAACSHVLMDKKTVYSILGEPSHDNMEKYDFIRRARKFTKNYFKGNTLKMTYCLKDVYNLHKWETINRSIKPIDFAAVSKSQKVVDVDTLGSQGCSGGVCEVVF